MIDFVGATFFKDHLDNLKLLTDWNLTDIKTQWVFLLNEFQVYTHWIYTYFYYRLESYCLTCFSMKKWEKLAVLKDTALCRTKKDYTFPDFKNAKFC